MEHKRRWIRIKAISTLHKPKSSFTFTALRFQFQTSSTDVTTIGRISVVEALVSRKLFCATVEKVFKWNVLTLEEQVGILFGVSSCQVFRNIVNYEHTCAGLVKKI